MQEFRLPSTDAGFSAVLQNSVAEGMKRVLGDGGTQAILYHIHLSNFDNPKEFHERLFTIFGVGTASLERVILEQLHQSMGVRPAPAKDDDFVRQVQLARRYFDATARRDRRQ